MNATDLTRSVRYLEAMAASSRSISGESSEFAVAVDNVIKAAMSGRADWRVLGGVIPGPIPVEWVRVGDTIQDHGVTGTITRAVRSGGMVHLVIGSGHVSFAKVAQQDFITVLSAGAAS